MIQTLDSCTPVFNQLSQVATTKQWPGMIYRDFLEGFAAVSTSVDEPEELTSSRSSAAASDDDEL